MFKERSVKTAAWIVSILLALFTVVPVVWIVATSFKTAAEINAWPPTFLPVEPPWANFHEILYNTQFPRYIFNSFLVSAAWTICIMITSSIAGFVFAKYKFPLRGPIFLLLLASATIPLEAYMIPVYIMVYKANMLNTYMAMIYPITIMTFGVFFMRQVIMGIPDELLEAARIDGASELWIYLRIILHLSKSGLMAIGVFAFTQAWANFMWPLVVVSTGDMNTTELGLAVFQRAFYTEYGPIAAGAVISIVPMLLVFAALRRHIMAGIATSGMKG